MESIKQKFKKSFSIEWKTAKSADNYIKAQYGVSRAGDANKIGTDVVEFNIARHLLSDDALEKLESSKNNNTTLSSDLIEKIKKSNGSDITQLQQEAKKELEKEGSPKNDLFALQKVLHHKGIEFEVQNTKGNGKRLVVYIDDSIGFSAEEQITAVMKGLGINSPEIIKDAIKRFAKQEVAIQSPQSINNIDEGYSSGEEGKRSTKGGHEEPTNSNLQKISKQDLQKAATGFAGSESISHSARASGPTPTPPSHIGDNTPNVPSK